MAARPDQPSAQTGRPNVVFILADDHDWPDLSGGSTNLKNGSDYYRTPRIDALALPGMAFTDAYASPNCTPTRAALMSGQHANLTKAYAVGPAKGARDRHRSVHFCP